MGEMRTNGKMVRIGDRGTVRKEKGFQREGKGREGQGREGKEGETK